MGRIALDIPLRGDKNSIDLLHPGHIKSNEPHRSRRQAGNAASHSLELPAVGITDATRLPKNNGSNDPSPEELPEQRRPPLPTSALLHSNLLRSAVHLSTGNAKAGVKLARDHVDDNNNKELNEVRGEPCKVKWQYSLERSCQW